MPFIHDDFLLTTPTARKLYHEIAKEQPILDYHTHLSPKTIAYNEPFDNLYSIWLSGDHYKWRAMRANGIPEPLVTGDASDYDKFLAYAKTVPYTLRNPLYHWTHLELKRYFGIDELLSPDTAPAIWEEANRQLATEALSPVSILIKFQVEMVGTTDDPADTLEYHQQIKDGGLPIKVLPSFRPDPYMNTTHPERFQAALNKLSSTVGYEITDLESLLKALEERHTHFHQLGGRLSDHGLTTCPSHQDKQSAAQAISKALKGNTPNALEQEALATEILLHTARLNTERGWTLQLHIGAIRNNRTALFDKIGADIGCDSMGDYNHIEKLSRLLDNMDRTGNLPRTVLYNINPADNASFVTMAANFQDGSTPGKIQYGAGWWFLDQYQGIIDNLDAISCHSLLARFIGMLTDSRSFMSFPRHEYFRRILCEIIGQDIEKGILPDDDSLITPLIEGVCYKNAQSYLGL